MHWQIIPLALPLKYSNFGSRVVGMVPCLSSKMRGVRDKENLIALVLRDNKADNGNIYQSISKSTKTNLLFICPNYFLPKPH